MKVVKQNVRAAAAAAALLKNGGVVICPTDTVYGFLADASNKKAVEKIYKLKRRPKSKPLSLFVADLKMAKEIVEIDVSPTFAKASVGKQEKLLRGFWPGKVTAVLKRKPGLKLHGLKKDTVAIRISNHSFLKQVLILTNKPLVQTSVNLASQEPLNSIESILATFGKSRLVGLIIDACLPVGRAGA